MSLISYPTATILLILSVAFDFSEACSSRSTPKVRPPHVTRPNVTHRNYPCPKGPAEMLCLNGGTCFTVFENSTDYFCKCPEGYCGVTCGDKYTRNGCYSSSSSSLVIVASAGVPRPPETFPCPPGPAEWLCLNGGTCFTVFENATDFACQCTEGYCGLTCGEKYTRYGCFSRYLVISASAASAGTAAVLLVVFIVISCAYYHKKSASADAELEVYFERSLKLRMSNRDLSLGTYQPDGIKDGADSGQKKDFGNFSGFLYGENNFKEKKPFKSYSGLIRLI